MIDLLKKVVIVVFMTVLVFACDVTPRVDMIVGDTVRIQSGKHKGCYAVVEGAYMVPDHPMVLTLRSVCSRVNDGISELLETSEDNVRRVDW
jgi:hypothetical protein